jgi:hypothetical protein
VLAEQAQEGDPAVRRHQAGRFMKPRSQTWCAASSQARKPPLDEADRDQSDQGRDTAEAEALGQVDGYVTRLTGDDL